MRIFFSFLIFLFFSKYAISQSLPNQTSNGATRLRGNPSTSLRGSGMVFTENKGEIVDASKKPRPDILYKGNGGGTDVYIRTTGISYVASNIAEITMSGEEYAEEKLQREKSSKK